jgi:hypothetical protein
MCTIKWNELQFAHIVEFTHDSTIFAAARENGSGRIRLFLINESTGNVYSRNGQVDSWGAVCEAHRYIVFELLVAARQNHTPVFKITGNQAEKLSGSRI